MQKILYKYLLEIKEDLQLLIEELNNADNTLDAKYMAQAIDWANNLHFNIGYIRDKLNKSAFGD